MELESNSEMLVYYSGKKIVQQSIKYHSQKTLEEELLWLVFFFFPFYSICDPNLSDGTLYFQSISSPSILRRTLKDTGIVLQSAAIACRLSQRTQRR